MHLFLFHVTDPIILCLCLFLSSTTSLSLDIYHYTGGCWKSSSWYVIKSTFYILATLHLFYLISWLYLISGLPIYLTTHVTVVSIYMVFWIHWIFMPFNLPGVLDTLGLHAVASTVITNLPEKRNCNLTDIFDNLKLALYCPLLQCPATAWPAS